MTGTDHDPRVRAAHDAAVARGLPGYADPVTGLFVFTAAALADRGRCCRQGCRHCPYVRAPRHHSGQDRGSPGSSGRTTTDQR